MAEQGTGQSCRQGFEVDQKERFEEKCLKLSITEGGKEGKSKVIASCSCLGEKFQECT